MIKFDECESRISEKQIRDLEVLLNVTFPKKYKDHLLKYNGGYCTPNEFTFIEREKETKSIVDYFLAIYDGEYDNLEEYIRDYKINEKRLPLHIIPIAHDPGGNLICLSCGIDDFGKVYFWDHENEVDYSIEPDTNYSNLYLVSSDLDQFFNELK